MTSVNLLEPVAYPPPRPPTQDELPSSDGVPMETYRHFLQMSILIDTLSLHWIDRPDGFVGGNMFVYFSPDQLLTEDYRGPDFFAVLGVPKKERKSWLVWEEQCGPHVVIELLSDSTAHLDRGKKKRIYQEKLRVPEYFWADPFGPELAGFELVGGQYEPIEMDAQGRLPSRQLGLLLGRVEGSFRGVEAPWLRWMTPLGQLLPTDEEMNAQSRQEAQQAQQQAQMAQQQAQMAQQQAQQAHQQAQMAEQQAQMAQQQAQMAQQQAEALEAQLARYRERFGDIG